MAWRCKVWQGKTKGGIALIYKWKIPGLIPVDAQVAGQEMERIYNRDGILDPAVIVQESKDKHAPLHGCFEWNDTVAANKYRVNQAKEIIRSIVTVSEHTNQETRAFVYVNQEYQPLSVVIRNPEDTATLLRQAINELRWFEQKYSKLQELAGVMAEIGKVVV